MSGLTKLALALVIIGGLNWLLVGLFDFNLVSAIFGATSILTRAVYVIVGLAAIYCLKLFTYPTLRARTTDEFRRAA
jgi:uncharacterized membrane protein YuzA (DUF378 family)